METEQPSSPAEQKKPATQQAQKSLTPTKQIRERVEAVLEPVSLPSAQRGQVVETVTKLIAERFVGPMPHPKHLADYEACCPGLADRIAAMAEYAQRKSEERMDVVVAREFDERRLGLWLGFSALVLLVVAGAILVLAGHPAIGTSMLAASLLSGLAGVFVHGRSLRPDKSED